MAISGVYKVFGTPNQQNWVIETPCEYGNEELIQSLTEFWSNEATRITQYLELVPPYGEAGTLVETIELPTPPPSWLAPLPRVPSMLPEVNYPFIDVNIPIYHVTQYASPEFFITAPTPETQVLVVALALVILTYDLEEREMTFAPFVPIFFEPHLLFFALCGGTGRVKHKRRTEQ